MAKAQKTVSIEVSAKNYKSLQRAAAFLGEGFTPSRIINDMVRIGGEQELARYYEGILDLDGLPEQAESLMKTKDGKTSITLPVNEDLAFALDRIARFEKRDPGRVLVDMLSEAAFESRVPDKTPTVPALLAFRRRTR